MGNAVEHESVGGLLESYTFIKTLGIFLGLNIYLLCIEILFCCFNGIKHYLLAITFASFCSYYSTY